MAVLYFCKYATPDMNTYSVGNNFTGYSKTGVKKEVSVI
jgi:hypothetical protein